MPPPVRPDLAVLSASLAVVGLRIALNRSASQDTSAAATAKNQTQQQSVVQSQTKLQQQKTRMATVDDSLDEQKKDLGSSSSSNAAPLESKTSEGEADPDKARLERVVLDAFAAQAIKIGDQLGLYVALYEAQSASETGFASLQEICDRAKTDSRLTYEWLCFQVKTSYISIMTLHTGQELFRLEESMAKYLLPPAFSPVSMVGLLRLGTCMMSLQPVMRAFETGQQTLFLPDEHPDVKFDEDLSQSKKPENWIRYARETFGTKFFRDSFVDTVLLRITGGREIATQLEQGTIDVADVFCGSTSGLLCIALAGRFRSTRFIGFESSHVSLTRARDLAHAAETKNARFYDIKERSIQFGPPPSTSRKRTVRPGFGLVLTFMTMSMVDAETQLAVFKEVRAGLDQGAPWIIMDLDPQDSDLSQAMSLGMSMLHFLPSLHAPQACSAFTERRCQQLAQLAGFSSVVRGPSVSQDLTLKLRTFILRC